MKLLYITKKIQTNPLGGRDMLTKQVFLSLRALLKDQFHLCEINSNTAPRKRFILRSFTGYIDGITPEFINTTLDFVKRKNITVVFLDGSNLGHLSRIFKRKLPSLHIITFFHNCESHFFWRSFLNERTIHSLGVYIANTLAERKAVKFSNKIICLCERDSKKIKNYYGRFATSICSIALGDQFKKLDAEVKFRQSIALFVGGSFYANRSGILWFIDNVLPKVDIKLCIVGKGMESLSNKISSSCAIELIGSVDSLSHWYRRAQFVIAPIYEGSGMKTKVAEALMFGKKVIGSSEAFVGYDEVVNQAGWVCDSVEDYVLAINQAKISIVENYDETIRSLFLKYYSTDALTSRLRRIIYD